MADRAIRLRMNHPVIVTLLLLAIIAFYPSIRDSSEQFEELLNAYPDAITEAFGIDDFSSFAGFVGAEALNVIWPLVAAGFAIVVGSAAVAGEIERGSVDLWLSVPVARWRLLLAKIVAAQIGLLVIVVALLPFGGIERLFGYFGLLMLVFLATAIHQGPDWGEVAHGFVPSISDSTLYLYFVVGVFAAALMPYEVHFYSSGAVEEGWETIAISTRVNNPRHDAADCIEPLA